MEINPILVPQKQKPLTWWQMVGTCFIGCLSCCFT